LEGFLVKKRKVIVKASRSNLTYIFEESSGGSYA
jgi:hypothetical protein